MSKPQDKRRRRMMVILSVICVLGVLLPVSIGIGILVGVMTQALVPVGYDDIGIQVMLHVLNLFTFVFGIMVIFNEFYFSNDIEYLLPWPLRAWQIVAAKYTAALFNENIMQCILVLSCMIGYGIGSGMDIAGWLLSIIGIVTLPVLPMAYCGILSMLIMSFTKLMKNKDSVQRFTVALLLIALFALVLSIGRLQNMDIVAYIGKVVAGERTVFHFLNYIFPNVPFYVEIFREKSITALFGYIAVNIIAVAVMLMMAEVLYFNGIIRLNSAGTKTHEKSLSRLLAGYRSHSQAFACFMREVRILVRTPVFFTNCVMINFIWPVFLYAMYKIQRNALSMAFIRELYALGNRRVTLMFPVVIAGISLVIAAINSISSGAISREGRNFSFIKYIPVPYMVQWHMKALAGVSFSLAGVLIYVIPFCIYMEIPLLHILLYTILSILTVVFVSYMGVYIDSIQPKLIWDDEMSALRENYNTFFCMGISLFLVAVCCIGGYFLFMYLKVRTLFATLLLIVLFAAGNILVLRQTKKYGIRNIEEQEET
jgi:ABC-2 type transport system permease protein